MYIYTHLQYVCVRKFINNFVYYFTHLEHDFVLNVLECSVMRDLGTCQLTHFEYGCAQVVDV